MKHVFLGIGFSSGKWGPSKNIPIDVISLLLAADKERRRLDPVHSKIYVFVADHLARAARDAALQSEDLDADTCARIQVDDDTIRSYTDEIIATLKQVCHAIHIEQVIFEDSRALMREEVQDGQKQYIYHEAYRAILNDVHEKKIVKATDIKKNLNHAWHEKKQKASKHIQVAEGQLSDVPEAEYKLDGSTEQYVYLQTALVAFYSQEKHCASKISWCIDFKKIDKSPYQIIIDSRLDELWFDTFYHLYLEDRYPIQFVYTEAGQALSAPPNKSTALAPYYQKDPAHYPRIVFGDTLEQILGNEQHESKLVKAKPDASLQAKSKAHVSEGLPHHSLFSRYNKYDYAKIRKEYLHFVFHLFNQLKNEPYRPDQFKIQSEERSFDLWTFVSDLLHIATLGNAPVLVEKRITHFSQKQTFFNASHGSLPLITEVKEPQATNDHELTKDKSCAFSS